MFMLLPTDELAEKVRRCSQKMCDMYACVCARVNVDSASFASWSCLCSSQLQLKIKRLHVCQAAWIVRSICICITALIFLFNIVVSMRRVLCFFFCCCFHACFEVFVATQINELWWPAQLLSRSSAVCIRNYLPPNHRAICRDTCKIARMFTNIFLVPSAMENHWPQHIMCTTYTHARDFGRWLKCIVRVTNIHVLRFKISSDTPSNVSKPIHHIMAMSTFFACTLVSHIFNPESFKIEKWNDVKCMPSEKIITERKRTRAECETVVERLWWNDDEHFELILLLLLLLLLLLQTKK